MAEVEITSEASLSVPYQSSRSIPKRVKTLASSTASPEGQAVTTESCPSKTKASAHPTSININIFATGTLPLTFAKKGEEGG